MLANFEHKTVLITGGTRGIGLSTALLFARLGARCILTYRWGSADEHEVKKQFEALGAQEPILFQADVAHQEDTEDLMRYIRDDLGVQQVDIFVSNVSFSSVTHSFEDYSLQSLKKSLRYSAWPMVAYTKQLYRTLGKYPRYIVGLSSPGPDQYYHGYDYVAFSKAIMEMLCKYMSYRLRDQHVCVNVVRGTGVKTKSLESTFGSEFEKFAKKLIPPSYWIAPEEIAGTVAMLCSGLLDAVRGQIITVDRGVGFYGNVMDIYTRRSSLPIFSSLSNVE